MRNILVPLFAIIIFLVLWELLVWVNDWPNYKMASPSDLWPAFWKFRWLFLSYGWDTLWRTIVGLSLSVFVGVGFGFMYLPAMSIIDHWFDRNLGLATGIAAAGSGIGQSALAPLSQLMIRQEICTQESKVPTRSLPSAI